MTAISGALTVAVVYAGPGAGGPNWTYTVTDATPGAGSGFDRLAVDLSKTCTPPVFTKSPYPHVYPEHGPSAHWVFDYIKLETTSTFTLSCDADDGGKATVESQVTAAGTVTSGSSVSKTVVSRLGPVSVDGPK